MKSKARSAFAWLLAVNGCSAIADPAPPKGDPSLVERVTSLARADPSLSQALQRRRAFVTNQSRFETTPSAPGDAAFVQVEPGQGFQLSLSRRNHALAKLATDSELALEDGVLTSRLSSGARALWLQSGDTLEQLLLSESGEALELDWRLELEPPIVSVRRERSGSLLLTDQNDRGVLRVPVPFALDAAGSKLFGRLDYRLQRGRRSLLELRFSLPGTAHPPLLVDPALSVVLWQARQTERRPPARARAAFAYHPGLGAVVLHGGSNLEAGPEVLGDTWAYDGEWTQLEPSSGGPARYSHGLAYTGNPPSLLTFGGRDENRQLSGATYRWVAGAWTEVATTGPSKRDDLGMAHVPSSTDGDVILFGGSGNSGWEDDTWLWNGTAWGQKTNAGGQGAFGLSLVFDSARQRALAFGGARSVAIHLSSLALFDGTRWVDTPDAKAPTRAYAAMAFDSDRKRALLFGGEDSEANFKDETWEWDSASAKWSERPTDVAPPPSIYGSMAYDPERKRATFFGGFIDGNTGFGETWEYRVLGGSCATDADCEGLPCVDGACCRKAECGSCEACATTTGDCESVKGKPDPDSCAGARSCDAEGVCKLAVAQPCRDDQDCQSGACADGVCCDRACAGACEACDSDGAVGTCSFVRGAPRHGRCEADPGCGGECEGDSASCAVMEAGTDCGSSCDDAVLEPATCDGEGHCQPGPSHACPGGFACATDRACHDRCEVDADCRSGLGCRDAECVPRAVYCSERSTLHTLDGDEQSCAPFACVSGACLESCASAAQCAEGFVCDENDECIAPPRAGSSNAAGCGCRVPGDAPGAQGGWLLLGLLFGAALRNVSSHPGAAARRRTRYRSARIRSGRRAPAHPRRS